MPDEPNDEAPPAPPPAVLSGEIQPTRDPQGRFAPGGPGGPGRRGLPAHVREILEAATPKAAMRLVEALDATKIVHWQGREVGEYTDHEMRKRAAEAIYARLYGNPPQAVAFDPEGDGRPLGLVFIPIAPPRTEE